MRESNLRLVLICLFYQLHRLLNRALSYTVSSFWEFKSYLQVQPIAERRMDGTERQFKKKLQLEVLIWNQLVFPPQRF